MSSASGQSPRNPDAHGLRDGLAEGAWPEAVMCSLTALNSGPDRTLWRDADLAAVHVAVPLAG